MNTQELNITKALKIKLKIYKYLKNDLFNFKL